MTELDLLKAMPVAVYVTDANGRITFYNDAAADLWGRRPEIGSARWHECIRLFFSDGRPMRLDESPMAVTLREGRACLGREVVAERPDGSRVAFVPFPSPLKDATGRVVGGINLLIDISARKQMELDSARLAAIVASSEDAIVSKTLEGVVTSWNAGATRIFGYEPEEMIGQSIKRIIPPELQDEEDDILARLRRGERIEHFDTVRLARDGRRVDISVTISPIRDNAGNIVGASKVGRDIGERKRHEEMQRLLFDELNHRVKNTLATVQAIASQSLRRTATPAEFVASFNGRVQALARAHDLLVQGKMRGTTLRELLREQVALGSAEDARIAMSGPDVMLGPRIAVQVALVVHELATNARKYGALAVPAGRISILWSIEAEPERSLLLHWLETGLAGVDAPRAKGFGMTLIERSLAANGGEAVVHYAAEGLRCRITLPLGEELLPSDRRESLSGAAEQTVSTQPGSQANTLRGRRVLLIEDEPLVALDMESELMSLGLDVVGPASNVAAASRLIDEGGFEVALLDANLHGQSVEQVAGALAVRRVPFAFATGYGREGLPPRFADRPMLAKPFDRERLARMLLDLLAEGGAVDVAEHRVVPLRQRPL